MEDEEDQAQRFWDRVAADWEIQVGDTGDRNRQLNSDPVLWKLLGDVNGCSVLDAGCGTGYLTRQLFERGAHPIGVDFSREMIAIARSHAPEIDFRVDTCSTLATVQGESIDRIVSNYMLMDTPDLEASLAAFRHVLVPDGEVVIIFSHPCFPQSRFRTSAEDGPSIYDWNFNYFDPQQRIDPPWAHFTSEFIWFHRPLSDYWKAFRTAGFEIIEFEEPRLAEERVESITDDAELQNHSTRPYSVAFKLKKQS